MTKEKIIKIMQKHWHQDGYYTTDFDSDVCATTTVMCVVEK